MSLVNRITALAQAIGIDIKALKDDLEGKASSEDLTSALSDVDARIGDIGAVLDAINGEEV